MVDPRDIVGTTGRLPTFNSPAIEFGDVKTSDGSYERTAGHKGPKMIRKN